MTARLTHPTPLWRTLIALIATSVVISGLTLAFGAAPARAATPATVSITFDDGYADQYAAAQYLQSKGLVGTFYINSGLVGEDDYLSLAQVQNISAMGHEIGGHTVSHENLPSVTEAEARAEICNDRVQLAEWGLSVSSFAWPFAAYTDALKQVVADCGYSSARGLGDVQTPLGCEVTPSNPWCATRLGESMPPSDLYFTAAPSQVERNWTVQDLRSSVEATKGATTGDDWLQLTFHHVCATMAECPDDEEYNPAFDLATFKQFADWLADEVTAGHVVVRTVGAVIGGTSQPPVSNSVPGAPTAVQAAVDGDGAVEVSWKAPASNGGSPITGYKVTSTPGGEVCTTDALSCVAAGLTAGTQYTFTVTATNAVGEGPGATAQATAVTVPGAPTDVQVIADNGSATVSWKAPASNGGSPITGYKVTSTPGGAVCTTDALSCVAAGLTAGTQYTFTVTATNAVGEGPGATAQAAAATVPGAPTSVKAVAGSSSATVSWKAPASNGGSKITRYTVTSTPGGKVCTTGALSCVVSGLTNGTSYTFKVTATNAKGVGAASAASSAIKPTTAFKVKVTKSGYGNVLAVDVDPDTKSATFVFRVERKAGNGTWTMVNRYRTTAPKQTRSVTLGAGVYRVVVPAQAGYATATSTDVRLTAPTVKVKLGTNSSKSTLVVDVDPNKGSGYWKFKVQKRNSKGTWSTLSTTYKTSGSKETKTVNLSKGTYRVVVTGKYGYAGATSKAVSLRK